MDEAFGRARFAQQLKRKGIDVNKMHSDNVKDAEAAKKRAATAQSDLDSFRKRTGVTSESLDDLTGHTRRRLATIIKDPSHPMHSAAKAEMDRRNMTRESFKTFVEAKYTDSGWQKPKKDNMSDADAMKKAKKLAKNAVILTKSASAVNKPVTEVSDDMKARYIRGADASHRAARSNEREAIAANNPEKAKKFKDIMKKRNAGMAKAFGEGVTETKGAPKGYHFTRDGKLKKGDAGADGDGGAKLRSDPLDKQRSKIPPLPEKFANPAQQAAVMAKLKKSGKYDGKESKLDELSTKTLTNYKAKADYSREKAQNSAAANYMRGTKGSGGKNDPDIKTMQKRDTGSSLYYSRAADKLRKQLSNMKKEATIPDGQTVMTKSDPGKKNDMDKLAKIRKMLDREKKK